MVVFYMLSPRVRRSLVYGKAPRNRLDLYLPPGAQRKEPVPVVIYITGAARAECFCHLHVRPDFLAQRTARAGGHLHHRRGARRVLLPPPCPPCFRSTLLF